LREKGRKVEEQGRKERSRKGKYRGARRKGRRAGREDTGEEQDRNELFSQGCRLFRSCLKRYMRLEIFSFIIKKTSLKVQGGKKC
jgi:hypothetical protein